ncbi:MAG: alpha/beta hydrolase-fold protein [SAR202 cluster bacterium]|jgi:hypothetical protein|nr:alpha/beta hydrolase-fold protein [SAR202 cluster bacterium]MDP6715558.1 alpha/beta hydrolase-fold protein [SAR202 cluster bacterium]
MTESRTQAVLPGTDFHLFTSAIADDEFEVLIAPLRRADDQGKRYPVVYAPDANSTFAWIVHTAGTMMVGGELPEMIVVGIGHPIGSILTEPAALQKFFQARTWHLTPTAGEAGGGGGAEKFLGFIRDELIPFVDSNYPTNPEDRTLLGYSYGGLFSVYALLNNPEIFDRYVAGSPSLGFDDGVIFQHERASAASRPSLPVKLFMSAGSLESEKTLSNVEQMVEALKGRNYEDLDLTSVVFPDETHVSAIGGTLSRGLRAVFQG